MVSSLRVSVFGISRSGKDYSISSAVKTLNDLGIPFRHIQGIPTVREYSEPILGKKFLLTSTDEKGLLMEVFRKKISDRSCMPYLIQDEHYAFPTTYGGKPLNNDYTDAKFPFFLKKGDDGREYEVVFKEEWMSGCDTAFYIDPDPDVVLRRIRSSEGAKRTEQISEEDIDLWKKFETKSLKEICKKRNLCLEVLKMNEGAAEEIIRWISAALETSKEE
jgi:hypothetical protein